MDTRVQMIMGELRQSLERLYGNRLVSVVLYGSHARGEEESGSDIDVLVVLEGPVDSLLEIARSEFEVADLSLRHDVVISCIFVSRDRYERERSPLLVNVRREGVAV